MHKYSPSNSNKPYSSTEDEYLFGWDFMPGIVSVWANREGLAIIWRREGTLVTSIRERFRSWLFATSLDDLAHLGSRVVSDFEDTGNAATFIQAQYIHW